MGTPSLAFCTGICFSHRLILPAQYNHTKQNDHCCLFSLSGRYSPLHITITELAATAAQKWPELLNDGQYCNALTRPSFSLMANIQ